MQGLYQGEFSRSGGVIGDGGIWSGEITNGVKFSDTIKVPVILKTMRKLHVQIF